MASRKSPKKEPKGKGGGKPPKKLTKAQRSRIARVQESIVLNRRQSFQYAQMVGNKEILRLLELARKDLLKRLSKMSPWLGNQTFSPVAAKAALAQIEEVIAQLLAPGVRNAVTDSKRVAMALAHEDTLRSLTMMDERFKGIVAPLRLKVAMQVDNRAKVGPSSTVLRRLATQYPKVAPGKGIMARYGMGVINAFEERLRVGIVTGKSMMDMREDLTSESQWLEDNPTFWAQRIVRTETMGAYNRESLDTGKEVEEELGEEMVKILVAGFDDRTSWDSYQVHGQIRRLDEPFEWNTKKGETIAYMTPPNRPNDRETVVFHRLEWPIPDELKPVPDAVYEARFAAQNKKGSAPARPKMTTIPLSKFAKE